MFEADIQLTYLLILNLLTNEKSIWNFYGSIIF